MDLQELLITSCRAAQPWSACLWDPSTGNALHTYKNGGIIGAKTLNLIGSDYILSGDEDKPMTHIWAINSQEPDKKMSTILAEKATIMTLCPKSCYLATGIGIKLYIWHLPSGKLFTIHKKNFQPITCIKFSSDGCLLVIGGQDGMLFVYTLASLVSLHDKLMSQSEGRVEPLYSKHDHSLPITDIHVGYFEHKGRLITVSSDNTCKLYTLQYGELLLNLIFDEPLTAVIFDGPCWNLYVGRNSGIIQQFYLKEPPRNLEHHVTEGKLLFQGHQKRVTCLDLGVVSGLLFSGSEDNFVFVWEISSRQILKRIEHKGAVTNIRCVLQHNNFFAQNFKIKHVVKNLDRDLIQSEEFLISSIDDFDVESSDDEIGKGECASGGSDGLRAENAKLRAINQQLYEATMKVCRKNYNF